ncbi:MAG TPA: IS1595 family transposase [Acidobacteriaceae bacterium]|jgi:transposase-like protein|nr:IS1595 family transposase [Acidobacteriaceae bacterium]
MDTPKTLLDAIQYFSDAENCRQFMIAIRWADGVVRCPHCGSEKVTYMAKAKLYNCNTKHPKQKFSLKVGTIFEDSPIGLEKWLPAFWLLSNCKNGISSYELHRALGVTQKSAWFMLHRIRTVMIETGDTKLGLTGPVECDETFVGGKAKNMHRSKRKQSFAYQGGGNKAIVMGMLERGGKVRAGVIEDRKPSTMRPALHGNVEAGAHVITDEHGTYPFIAQPYYHEVIKHVEGYVRDHIHTNGIENFWSLLKRGLTGTYISVEPAHLNAYVVEQVYRYNNRKDTNDSGRFSKLLSQVVGKRITYAELTGKEAGAAVS